MAAMTREQLVAEVKRMDPALSEDSSTFTVALILLASAVVGPNVVRISKLLGVPRSVVAHYSATLRRNRVWVRGKIRCNWHDEETGGAAFWIDVCVAEGLMERVGQ